jgi:serine phosphatase RsbU (regulator of sigma subunit)
MLISPDTVKDSFKDFFLLFNPKDIVSGDFYWLAEIENEEENLTFMACVDCTGHGVAGALMSMIGESLLNQIIYEHEIYEPGEIMNNLNIGVQEILNQNENNMHHGMDASILIIDKNNNKVSFAGAKQNLVYTNNGKIEVIKGDRLSIGGFVDQERGYKKHELELKEKDSMFYMFSDGYQDQFGGPDNKKIGVARLIDTIDKNKSKTMSKQKEAIEKLLSDWKGAEEQTDDIMVMGIKL